ncbi:MAG: tetratricopeptide repeat protein [gamma proteobacterium symbiont of Taylorina sp.]|nr:tetratricopeptide repeat protein [gamma proteobacterium symbiont of Taylorina sp.]
MSVINQMLRDLEQRKVQSGISSHYIDEVNIVAKKTINLWFPVLILLLALILITALYFYPVKINESMKKESAILAKKTQEKIISRQETIKISPEQKEIKAEPIQNKVDPISEKQAEKHIEKQQTAAEVKQEAAVTQSVSQKKDPISTSPEQKKTKKKPKVTLKPEQAKTLINHPVRQTIAAPTESKVTRRYSRTIVQNTPLEIVNQARQLMSKDISKAIELLEQNLIIITPDADYYATLANLYLRQKHFDNAIFNYQQALKLDKNKGELWIGLALSYKGSGAADKAEKAFKQAANSSDISPQLRDYAKQQ